MYHWRVSINHCQFGPTPSCTLIISSQYSMAVCCSPPHPFSQPFVLESCLSDLSDKQQQNCPVCKKQGHLFSICCQRFHTENWWDVSFIRGLGQRYFKPGVFCFGIECCTWNWHSLVMYDHFREFKAQLCGWHAHSEMLLLFLYFCAELGCGFSVSVAFLLAQI